MKVKKLIAAALTVALSASLFVGCSSGANTEGTNNTQTPTKTETGATSEKQDLGAINVIAADNSKPNPAKTRTGASNTLIIGTQEPKGEALPVYYSSTYDAYLVSLMFESMYSHDEVGAKVPVVAEDLPVLSEDKKTYTVKIKPGIKFSDGKELTTKDIKFTYEIMADPSYDGRYYYGNTDSILGAEEYRNGKADEITGIKIIDDYTVSFTFKEAAATNIDQLTTGIMPAHYYAYEKGNTKSLRDRMATYDFVGSGPYKMVKYEPKQFVEFVVNENYTNGEAAKIQNLIIKVVTPETMFAELQKGTVDVLLQVPTKNENLEQGKGTSFTDIRQYPANKYGFMLYNLRDPRLADKAVRHAMNYGFDRQQFVDAYYGPGNSYVCHGPVSSVSWAYTERLRENLNTYSYDKEKAIKLLEDAGWVLGADGVREKDGQRLEFKWYTYTGSQYVEFLIPMLTQYWSDLGIKVTAELMEFNTLLEKVFTKQDFEIANLAWSMTPDPDGSRTTFHSIADVPDGNNAGGFRNEQNDKLLDAGRLEFDEAKRSEIYTDWALLVNEELPYMFLDQGIQSDFINSRVKNFNTSSYITFPQIIKEVELEQ